MTQILEEHRRFACLCSKSLNFPQSSQDMGLRQTRKGGTPHRTTLDWMVANHSRHLGPDCEILLVDYSTLLPLLVQVYFQHR